MSKGSKSKSGTHEKWGKNPASNTKSTTKSGEAFAAGPQDGYLFRMSHAPRIDEASNIFQMLPVLFFTAVIIMIMRMHSYQRPMAYFFWSSGENNLTDFFSYYKMTAILGCAIVACIFLLYRIFIQGFYVKKSSAYIPMLVYILFVVLSYLFSDYKTFALWGWNDRFEGTLVLISYMVLLFYVINTVNSERNVQWLVYALAATSTLLGLLGLTQALDQDFFRTTIGKKLITPSWFWDKLDSLEFTFENKEIYQTVYNINYVSFYLTLLIPLFGMLFIHSMIKGKEEAIYKKILWGALFALTLYNLIGSASSGGLMGMAFVVIMALIILNKKILGWKKPVAFLLLITLVIGAASYERWYSELSNAFTGISEEKTIENLQAYNVTHKLDYIETTGNDVVIGYNGDHLVFTTYPDDPAAITIEDSDGKTIGVTEVENSKNTFRIDDSRYDWITVKPAVDESENNYILIITDQHEWPFLIAETGVKYVAGTGNAVSLHKVPAIGWENNQAFGSGRGYIWSRTIPMLKDTLVLGHGADTYCIYFPQEDYVGKYNSGTFSETLNITVDKPHNMYFGAIIGTGGISMLALLILWASYIVQSIIIYYKREYKSYLSFVGVGIFLGIFGFLVSGLVNDSTVSVMPMFYGLLGTGIAVNMILKD